jgi:hypothetical protein
MHVPGKLIEQAGSGEETRPPSGSMTWGRRGSWKPRFLWSHSAPIFSQTRFPYNERISESPALANTTEKVTPTKFSIRVFGSVSVLGTQYSSGSRLDKSPLDSER